MSFSWRGRGRRKHPIPGWGARLQLEALEARVTPATNLRVNGAHFTAPAIGALTNVVVDYSTEGLHADAIYMVSVTMNGITKTSPSLNVGAGAPDLNNWSFPLGDWLINDLFETITVSIWSPDNLSESVLTDNNKNITLESSTFGALGSRFVTPIAGTAFKNWTIDNYVDLDSGPGAKDYKGKGRTYNGNAGLDFRIAGFASMDRGVPVLAAADGIVTAIHDGEDDRNEIAPGAPHPAANYITINHGNGWTATYSYLRKNSVAVSVGDYVDRGQMIGLVGSSGGSLSPRLHFGVTYHGVPVETYVAPSAYWVNPLPYAGDAPQNGYQLTSTSKHYITENAGFAKITVNRPFFGTDKLHYFTGYVGDTARDDSLLIHDVDYTKSSGDIVFGPGELTKHVYIPIVNDDVPETAESFRIWFMLDQFNGFYEDWTIIDDDANFNLNNGTFTIKGSDNFSGIYNNDQITLDIDGGSLRGHLNGRTKRASIDSVSKVVIDAGDGNDTVNVRATPAGVPTLIYAGAGFDQINVGAGGSLTPVLGNVSIDGGSGENAVSIRDQDVTIQAKQVVPRTYALQNHTLTRAGVGTISYSGINSFDTIQQLSLLTGASGDTFVVNGIDSDVAVGIAGGGGNDTIIGPNTADLWVIDGANAGVFAEGAVRFTSIENVTGGTDHDSFVFKPSASIAGNLKGDAGIDTIEFQGTSPVSVNLASSKATRIGGTFSEMEGATAGSNALDQLIGANVDQSWVISDTNVARVGGFSANGFENLLGGNQADQFRFIFNGKVTGKIDGGAGADTLNYAKYGAAITVDLATKTFPLAAKAANIEAVVGTGFSDTLMGVGISSGINSWTITGTNSGHFSSANAQLDFSGIENLTGFSNSDLFEFFDGGSVTGVIDGKSSGDILSYQPYSSPITVNLATNTATATGGFASIEFLFGGPGSDTLIAGNAVNHWTITGINAGKINGGQFTFSAIENLTGGNSDDSFVFANGAAVTGSIDGGLGGDTLDYSAYVTSVKVDLTGDTATGAGGVDNIENAFGGSAGDELTGNGAENFLNGNGGADLLKGLGGADILLGGPGDDVLDGGDGNDLLIGGINVDKLTGGNDDDLVIGGDLLIGGVISHASNGIGLDLMRTEWKRTDLTYNQRIDLLRNTGVNGGLYKLNADNVIDDVTVDTLTGDTNQDWFWGGALGPGRDQMDNVLGEQVN